MRLDPGSAKKEALASTGETIEQLGYARMGKLASDAIEALPNSSLKTLLQQQLKGRFREDFFRRAKSGIPVRRAFFDTLYDYVPQTKTASNEYVASLLPETEAQNTQQDTAKVSENSDNIPPEKSTDILMDGENDDIITAIRGISATEYFVLQINSNEILQNAKDGIRHGGTYKDALKKSEARLRKSIESHQNQVKEHLENSIIRKNMMWIGMPKQINKSKGCLKSGEKMPKEMQNKQKLKGWF